MNVTIINSPDDNNLPKKKKSKAGGDINIRTTIRDIFLKYEKKLIEAINNWSSIKFFLIFFIWKNREVYIV